MAVLAQHLAIASSVKQLEREQWKHWGSSEQPKTRREDGDSVMTAFGQTAFGQNRIWPELVFECFGHVLSNCVLAFGWVCSSVL